MNQHHGPWMELLSHLIFSDGEHFTDAVFLSSLEFVIAVVFAVGFVVLKSKKNRSFI